MSDKTMTTPYNATKLSKEDLALVKQFFEPILYNHVRFNVFARTGVDAFGSTPTIRTIFRPYGTAPTVHILHSLHLITRLAGQEFLDTATAYYRLAEEVQGFLVDYGGINRQGTCPICGEDGLSLFLHFYGEATAIMGMGCMALRDLETREWVQGNRFVQSKECSFYHSLSSADGTYPSVNLWDGWERGFMGNALYSSANMTYGVANVVRKNKAAIYA